MAEQLIERPCCGKAMSVPELISQCTVSFPAQMRVRFECTHCGKETVLQMEDGLVETGQVKKEPDPEFVVDQKIHVPDLAVSKSFSRLKQTYTGLTLSYKGQKHQIPAGS